MDVAPDGAGRRVPGGISGGVFFHAVVQGRDITVQLPPQVTSALSGLPPASSTFTGRDREVEQLLQDVAPRDGGRQHAVLVTGLAGVGKTELAVQVATAALARSDWFPGGVLFTDLAGYDPKRRLSPERALEGLLRTLGIPDEHIPSGLQDRSRLYRGVLASYAEQGRCILVVIDNASTAEQARALLPTDGTTVALLTSRHTLDSLDARLYDLDILDESASVELLHQALHQARGHVDTRVADDPDSAVAIARLCAGLPLALCIAAALLAASPTRPLASLAQALQAEHSRLDRLCRADRAVRAAFDLSYQHLTDRQARLFRLLPLNPGPDLSTETAAQLVDTEPGEAEYLLMELACAHLIEPGHAWGRWRLHDLVRLYADEHGLIHADADLRDTARTRLFTHYQTIAEAADTHLELRPTAVSSRFPDRMTALDWFDAEHYNLIAAVTTAPTVGHTEASTALAFAIGRYLYYRRSFDDWITVITTALALFRESGDRHGEGAALNILGNALAGLRRFEEAIDAHTVAATIFRESADRHGEGQVLNNLGNTLREVRRFDDAVDVITQAATVFREAGDRYREGAALNNLGTALAGLRRFEEAIDVHTLAATIFRESGDRHSEGAALNNLGTALAGLRRFEEAIDVHTLAATIFRESGDRHSEGAALNNLGTALAAVGRFDETVDVFTQAATIFHEFGDRHGEGMALNNLGDTLREVRRFEEAIDAHTLAATIFRESGDRHSEGAALNNLGTALAGVGWTERAIDAHTQAAAVFRVTGDRHGEGMALNNLGHALAGVRRFDGAVDVLTQAAAVFREFGDQYSEGAALNNLGHALAGVRRFDDAVDVLTQAVAVFRVTGDRHGEGMALNLSDALAGVRPIDAAITARPSTILRSWESTPIELWLQQNRIDSTGLEEGNYEAVEWNHVSGVFPSDVGLRTAIGGGWSGGGPDDPHASPTPDPEGDDDGEEGSASNGHGVQPALTDNALNSVDTQMINFWIANAPPGNGPLLVGHTYIGCFRVGVDQPRNLAKGHREVPLEDIPPVGLHTTWVVRSTTAMLRSKSGDAGGVEVSAAQAGDHEQWMARFDLTIPATGESEQRDLEVIPLASSGARIDAMVLVGGDVYRELVIDLQTTDSVPLPQDPSRGPNSGGSDPVGAVVPTPSRQASTEVSAQNRSVSGSSDPSQSAKSSLPEQDRNPDRERHATSSAVTVRDTLALPAAHTALRAAYQWQQPPTTLRLTLLPPHACWTLSREGDDSPVGQRFGQTHWEPHHSAEQRILQARKALEEVRERCGARYSAIDAADVAERLQNFVPAADWTIPAEHATEDDLAAWQEVAAGRELRSLAFAGWQMFDSLFPSGSELRSLVCELKPGDSLRINWNLDGPFAIGQIPWTLLYLEQPPPAGVPVDPHNFLGMRLRTAHLAYSCPHDRSLEPEAARAHLLYWGDAPKDATASETRRHRGELAVWAPLFLPNGQTKRKEEVSSFLSSPVPSPVSLLYLFCQCATGSGAAPVLRFGSTNAEEDVLELMDLGTGKLPDQPLVFINACETSAAAPHFTNELHSLFLAQRGCRAYIGSECKVPTGFAARFATVFFYFLYRRDPTGWPTAAGEALVQARKFFWDEYRSIGGLFYSYLNDDLVFVARPEEVTALRRPASAGPFHDRHPPTR